MCSCIQLLITFSTNMESTQKQTGIVRDVGERHPERPGPRHQGYIFEAIQELVTGLWTMVFGAKQPARASGPSPGVPAPVVGKEQSDSDIPFVRKVSNAAHSVLEHLGQEAAAVSSTLKDEAAAVSSRPHDTPPHSAPPATPTEHEQQQHTSVAGQLSQAMHSTLDHIAQDAEAVSVTAKQQLEEFMHPHHATDAHAVATAPSKP